MSGIESKQHFHACVDAGVKYMLTSFYQFYDGGDRDIVRKRKKQFPQLQFMVDSGAHTFISDYTKFQSWKREDFEKYVQDYCAWLEENREYIFCAVELDIDYALNMLFGGGASSTVGTSIVEGWQKQYFRPLEEKGLPIIYVWHVERKLEGWEQMCAQFGYVGLPGEMSKEPDFNKYITVARRYCAKIHGFGATKLIDYRDVPWYSIDSTSWKASERYGVLIHWDANNQKLIQEQDKSKRVLYRHHFEKHGLDADGIIHDTNYKEVTKYALISMRAMELFYEAKYANRVFYYELRLPPVAVVLRMNNLQLRKWWAKFRPAEVFPQHQTQDPKVMRTFLAAISAVQNRQESWAKSNPNAERFLSAYFPQMVSPWVTDISVFQREMALRTSPPNPPVLKRLDPELYIPQNNPPKARPVEEMSLDDLESSHTELVRSPIYAEL